MIFWMAHSATYCRRSTSSIVLTIKVTPSCRYNTAGNFDIFCVPIISTPDCSTRRRIYLRNNCCHSTAGNIDISAVTITATTNRCTARITTFSINNATIDANDAAVIMISATNSSSLAVGKCCNFAAIDGNITTGRITSQRPIIPTYCCVSTNVTFNP